MSRFTTEFLRSEAYASEGTEEFQAQADQYYSQFTTCARRVMVMFGLRSEAELILALPFEWTPELSSDRGASRDALVDAWQAVTERFRSLFFKDLKHNDSRRFAKAAAWYNAAYSLERSRDDSFLSFPWVVSDIMKELRNRNSQRLKTFENESALTKDEIVVTKIGQSIKKSWSDKIPILLSALSTKQRRFEEVLHSLEIDAQIKEVGLFGSVALYLCDHVSDIDVVVSMAPEFVQHYVNMPSLQRDTDFLKNHVHTRVTTVASSVRLVSNTEVPLVRLDEDPDSGTTSVDICVKRDGFNKATLIRTLYTKYPSSLVVFYTISEWAKSCGVVRGVSHDSKQALLKTGELQALIIKSLYLDKLAALGDTSVAASVSFQEHFDQAQVCSEYEVGLQVIKFFEVVSKYEGNFSYTWPIESEPVHAMSAEVMEKLASRCARAYHLIVVSRCWEYLLTQSESEASAETTFMVRLTPGLTEVIRDATAFHAKRLSDLSGAVVNIEEVASRLQISAIGTARQIQVLRTEVNCLMNSSRAGFIGMLREVQGQYFMEGATMLLGRKAKSGDTVVCLNDNPKCPLHLRHKLFIPSTPTVRTAAVPEEIWKSDFKSRLIERIIFQLSKMKPDEANTMKFSVHTGIFYTINAQACLDNRMSSISLDELEAFIIRCKSTRKMADDRIHYDVYNPDDLVEDTSNSSEKIEAGKPSSSGDGESKPSPVEDVISRKKNKNANMASSFFPSFGNTFPTPSDCTEMFVQMGKVLAKAGYVRLDGSELYEELPDLRQLDELKAFMYINNRFSTELTVTKQMVVKEIREKDLKWVHATLLHGETTELRTEGDVTDVQGKASSPSVLLGSHDLRIKVGTRSKISMDDALYQKCCPDGVLGLRWNDERNCPEILESNGGRVAFVRQVLRRVVFTPKSSDAPKLAVILASGKHFDGNNLEIVSNFADLSIEIDPSMLKEWVINNSLLSSTVKWLDGIFDEVIRISDLIRRACGLEN